MREADTSESVLHAADWLSLAAAPTFATMALLTSSFGDSATEMLCMTGGNWFAGMAPMYLLMSAFHSAPWLRLVFRGRGQAR